MTEAQPQRRRVHVGPAVGASVVEVVSPSCHACRAMAADLELTAAEYEGRVPLTVVDASTEPEVARDLNVMATPTLIGFRDGEEVFRVAGRRSRGELRQLFEAAAGAADADSVGRSDIMLRAGAGAALLAAGLLTGPAWPLVAIGGVVAATGLVPLMRRRR